MCTVQHSVHFVWEYVSKIHMYSFEMKISNWVKKIPCNNNSDKWHAWVCGWRNRECKKEPEQLEYRCILLKILSTKKNPVEMSIDSLVIVTNRKISLMTLIGHNCKLECTRRVHNTHRAYTHAHAACINMLMHNSCKLLKKYFCFRLIYFLLTLLLLAKLVVAHAMRRTAVHS